MMKNQAKKQHLMDLEQNKQGQGPSKPEHQQLKQSETGTNTPSATERDSSVQEYSDTPKWNSDWPNESLPTDGLVDREIGDGSEDLNDSDNDGDDELSTK